MTDSQKLDALIAHQKATDEKIDLLLEHMDNLSNHVEELAMEVSAMNARLTNVEKVVNLLASRAGVTSVPAIGGGRRQSMGIAAKGKTTGE